jgi:predicted Rossmann-fold nucleotide-binding protein
VVLVGTAYWNGLLEWMRDVQLPAGAIAESDLHLLQLTDDADEVVRIVRAYAARAHDDIPSEAELR